ncbi:MAG: hypothetical protein Q9160_001086 [Pyrenula sp. 1 TL-2023]
MAESPEDEFSDFSFAKQKAPRKFARSQKTWRSDDSDPSTETARNNIDTLTQGIQDNLLPENKYKYSPIRDDQIRLLILHPRQEHEDDDIKCSLMTFQFDESNPVLPRYQALSYFWGDGDPIHKIRLKDVSTQDAQTRTQGPSRARSTPQHSGHDLRSLVKRARQSIVGAEFYVRKNLVEALKHFRHEKRDLYLWIDALCIDQSNLTERNAQVRRINALYSGAFNVCIWLGKGSAATKRVMHSDGFIEKIGDPFQLDKYVEDTRDPKHDERVLQNWEDLADLMQSRWFSRRWVIQELALAHEASVHCGYEYLHWTVFRDAIASLNLKWPQIQQQEHYRKLRQGQEKVGEVGALGASVIVDAVSSMFTKTDSDEILERVTTLETLVSTLQSFESSKPRDLIYALLSIASDPPSNVTPIEVDYKKATLDVFSDFLKYCFESSGSLDMLCRHWTLRPHRGDGAEVSRFKRSFRLKNREPLPLPSYMPLAAGAPFGSGQHVLNGRRNGESFVGRPDRRNYQASKKLEPSFKFLEYGDAEYEATINDGKYKSPEGQDIMPPRYRSILTVKGFRLGPIEEVVGPVADGTITKDCLSLAGFETEDQADDVHTYPPKLWRTLVANRNSAGGPVNCLYENACGYCLAHVGPNGHINTGDLIQRRNQPETVILYLKRVREVVWNRKFIKCGNIGLSEKRDDFWGLGPPDAQVGDIACILFGCSVPVLLRPSPDREQRFTLVGESYIHGLMEGEAITGREKETWKFEDEWFNLV